MRKSFKILALVLVASVLFGIYYLKNIRPSAENYDFGPDIAVTFEEAMENDLPTFVEFKTST